MTLAKPQATYTEDEYRFEWPAEGVEMTLGMFAPTRDNDVRCELVVVYDHATLGGRVYSGHLLFSGPNSLRDVVTALRAADPDAEFWLPMVQQARDMARERYRTGEPPADLRLVNTTPSPKYLVRPFVFDRGITIFFGSEESAKSLFTLLLGVVVASGDEIAGIIADERGSVALLDWEDDAEVHRERMHAFCAAASIPTSEVHIEHKRMTASLPDSVREVRLWLGSIGARLVIIDSLGMACGGDPSDAQLMLKTMIAARGLGVPVIAIHHIARDAKDKTRPYGSVYAAAEARMTWQVEKDTGGTPGKLRIALTNRKTNRSARHPRQSFEFEFTVDEATEDILSINVRTLTFSQAADVGTGAGQKWVIATALKPGPLEVQAIADISGITARVVRMQLNRHKDFFVKLPDGRWAMVVDDARIDMNQSESLISSESNQGGYLIPPIDTPDTQGGEFEEGDPF